MMWRTEFGEMGGYDCMTGAWTIYDDEDRVVVVIDQGSYGQPRCKYDYRSERAEANARLIVSLVNKAMEVTA